MLIKQNVEIRYNKRKITLLYPKKNSSWYAGESKSYIFTFNLPFSAFFFYHTLVLATFLVISTPVGKF